MSDKELKQKQIKRYAFIDVSNTINTTKSLLGFSISWRKMIGYLKGDRWKCNKVFYYQGINSKGGERIKRSEKLEKLGYIARTKDTYTQPDSFHTHKCICDKCSEETEVDIRKQGNQKSNCDVELTVDALEIANSDQKEEKEFLIFTGDGDFCFLIENIIEKNIKVKIISNTKRGKNGNRRFSSRLRDLILKEEKSGEKRVCFVNIDNLKNLIEKKKTPRSVTFPE